MPRCPPSPLKISNPQGQTHIVEHFESPREQCCKRHEKLADHFKRGDWVSLDELDFGDVVTLCTDIDTYGRGLRPYTFWQIIEVDGEECPVFLSKITNGRKGPYTEWLKWYQKTVSWCFESPANRRKNAFICPAHCVYMKIPSHGEFFRESSGKPCYTELIEIGTWLDAIITIYPEVFAELCHYAAISSSRVNNHEKHQAGSAFVDHLTSLTRNNNNTNNNATTGWKPLQI